ncbi:MAG: macrolide export ATP-binding/permease protein MacB [Hyphococcus sp.]|nr:MAG: macrolide export ATP-binding/permease protein MacB [Marinicaulis sp.]
MNPEHGSSEALVRGDNVRKTYRMGAEDIHALDGVSFKIARGEFLSIMGPSGSGKSTLMNLLGALDRPSAGRLEIDNAPIGDMTPDQLAALRNRTIGFVFQQFNLLARTSALENVKLPMLYAHKRPSDLNKAAQEVLDLVGLGDRLDHHPAQLSGGQQQRVAIARALVNRPQILLADEPTGALDTQTSEEIMQLFTNLNQSGVTVIIVTHEQEIADWTNRVMRLRDGKIVTDERLKERLHVVS